MRMNSVMSFTSVIIALWFYGTCFFSILVDCAVLDRRVSLYPPRDSSPQNNGVTFVTKVVAVTSFLDPPVTTSSSATTDQSDGTDLVTKVIRVGPTTIDPAHCTPALCRAHVEAVSVYYWPQKSARTACLSTISALPSEAPPSGLIPQSPSIYAIFHSVSLSNGCGTLSTAWDSLTMSFAPGALSTVAAFADKAEPFNFADLPCPPPGLYVPPGELYQPQFAPPRAFFSSLQAANPAALQGCLDGVWADGWTDPPIAFVTEGPLEGPGQPGGGDLPRRAVGDGPANAHVMARSPVKTAGL